jgi:hypothetical protein
MGLAPVESGVRHGWLVNGQLGERGLDIEKSAYLGTEG